MVVIYLLFYSYVGAFRFSEVCLLLQNAALDPTTQTPNFNAIYPTYEKVLKEGKILQSHLAKLLEKPPDNTTIDSYSNIFLNFLLSIVL